jgi:Fur family transcriptional regulator, ferric uptake regulator
MPKIATVQPRNTKQKDAIRRAFQEANRPLSPEETCAFAKNQVKEISLATVYRNIRSLIADEWLEPVEIPGQATRYEIAGKSHHHHFQCNQCRKLFELEGCDIRIKPKLPRGFLSSGHEFFVYGTCAACR